MSRRQSPEAFWWSLFSAGGVLSALVLPSLVMASMLQQRNVAAHPQEAWARVAGLVAWWPVRVALGVVIALSFVHAAHRIRHVIMDLGWRKGTAPLSLMCYGGAFAGAGIAAWLLLQLHGPQ